MPAHLWRSVQVSDPSNNTDRTMMNKDEAELSLCCVYIKLCLAFHKVCCPHSRMLSPTLAGVSLLDLGRRLTQS